MAEPFDDLIGMPSNGLSLPTGEGIVIDIGTGDGVFVYQRARENPNKFYIGIDANPRSLEKVSEKTHRNPAKGGLPNVLSRRKSRMACAKHLVMKSSRLSEPKLN